MAQPIFRMRPKTDAQKAMAHEKKLYGLVDVCTGRHYLWDERIRAWIWVIYIPFPEGTMITRDQLPSDLETKAVKSMLLDYMPPAFGGAL